MLNNYFPLNNFPLRDEDEKFGTARQATDNDKHSAETAICFLDN